MQEFIPNICDVSDEEITQVRRRPAEVTALRKQVYLVVSDRPEDGIREFEIDPSVPFELENDESNEYFTHDLSQAVVRYVGLTLESNEASKPTRSVSPFKDEIKFFDDLTDELGLSPAERNFFV